MINNESEINRDPEEDRNMEKAQGRATDHREETTETGGWELVVPAFDGGNGGGGLRGDQKVCHEEAEHGHIVYCDATNYGPL